MLKEFDDLLASTLSPKFTTWQLGGSVAQLYLEGQETKEGKKEDVDTIFQPWLAY